MAAKIYRSDRYDECKNEQEFKMAWLALETQPENDYSHRFCIESESTMVGFPDVMLLNTGLFENKASFLEFKFSDKNGRIKFQPTQPSFYRRHPRMAIKIVAYNAKTKRVHVFDASMLFDTKAYRLTENATVNLNCAEEMAGFGEIEIREREIGNESIDCEP